MGVLRFEKNHKHICPLHFSRPVSLLLTSLSQSTRLLYVSLYRSLGSLSISSFHFLVHTHLSLLLHGLWGMRRRRKGERQVRKGQKRKGDLSAATHRCGCRWDGGTDEGPRGIVRPHLDCRLSLYCREIAGTLSPRRRPGAIAGNKCELSGSNNDGRHAQEKPLHAYF